MPANERVTSRRAYRVRTARIADRNNYSVCIPNHMAEEIPEEVRFIPEWHEDGLLYRVVKLPEAHDTVVPDWATS